MIYKLVSCDQVIAKVLADLDIRESAIRVSDMRDWCGEAVEKIGSVKQFKRKVSGVEGSPILTIVGNQAALPSDLHKLNHVTYSRSPEGPWLPMTVTTSSFNVYNTTPSTGATSTSTTQATSNAEMVQLAMSIYNMDYATALTFINDPVNSSSRNAINELLLKYNLGVDPHFPHALKYSIKPGYVMTNIPEGYLKISYDAIYVDDNGYPLIPDTIACIEAVYWYISMKLKYPEYAAGRMQREIYYDIRRSWNFYCKQAYADSMMPNEDEMETIKNNWNRLIPDMNAQVDSYETLGESQNIRNLTRN